MAINIPSGGAGEDAVVASINTTPLVDVMLVLLIIFLITIPVVNLNVPVDVPKQRHEVRQSQPQDIVISVDAKGGIFWFDAPVAGSAALVERLKKVAVQVPQPEVHIRGDASGRDAPVGRILLACQRAGIAKVGFITEPAART